MDEWTYLDEIKIEKRERRARESLCVKRGGRQRQRETQTERQGARAWFQSISNKDANNTFTISLGSLCYDSLMYPLEGDSITGWKIEIHSLMLPSIRDSYWETGERGVSQTCYWKKTFMVFILLAVMGSSLSTKEFAFMPDGGPLVSGLGGPERFPWVTDMKSGDQTIWGSLIMVKTL